MQLDELSSTSIIDCATLKRYTGSDAYGARGIRSGETECNSKMLIVFAMNALCKFDEFDNALARRTKLWKFHSKFTNDVDAVDPEKHVYLADKQKETKEWMKKYRSAWFTVLSRRLNKYIKGEYPEFDESNENKEMITEMLELNPFDDWITSVTDKMEVLDDDAKPKVTEYVTLPELLVLFGNSNCYNTLSKSLLFTFIISFFFYINRNLSFL